MLVNHNPKQHKKLHPTRIYLYICYTYNIMYNEELLVDVIEGNRRIFLHWNSGTTSTNSKGCFGYIKCWINKECIDNIFRIPKIEEMEFRITYEIQDGHYIVHTNNGEFQFNKYEMGPTYIETKKKTGRGLRKNRRGEFWRFHH